MRILVASSSVHRQSFYREVIEGLGDEVRVAASGLECAECLRIERPDLLVLETPLLWGGSDGVLALLQEQTGEGPLPVILVAAALHADDFFRLGRFRLDNFLFHVPTAAELRRAIASFASRLPQPRQAETVAPPS
jgi:CheY-like chemotaxis protein